MKHTYVVMEVRVQCDPIPGAYHEPKDHLDALQNDLNRAYPWYHPTVKIVRIEEE